MEELKIDYNFKFVINYGNNIQLNFDTSTDKRLLTLSVVINY